MNQSVDVRQKSCVSGEAYVTSWIQGHVTCYHEPFVLVLGFAVHNDGVDGATLHPGRSEPDGCERVEGDLKQVVRTTQNHLVSRTVNTTGMQY